MSYRIGLGQDSHPFSQNKDKPLILGGVKIEDNFGLEGDSDADVIIHSLCNSISSAVGGNSLGTWANKLCEDGVQESRFYLEYILNKINKQGYKIENISISVEAKKPRLQDEQITQIKDKLSQLLIITKDQIGITFTSGDGLTAFGRGEGIQAISTVLLSKNDQ